MCHCTFPGKTQIVHTILGVFPRCEDTVIHGQNDYLTHSKHLAKENIHTQKNSNKNREHTKKSTDCLACFFRRKIAKNEKKTSYLKYCKPTQKQNIHTQQTIIFMLQLYR